MGMSWTEEQSQVINLRDRNMLVAAAAGSGKTAVLVERIIRKITDPDRPVDIDRLLVVTFTKAAAAEMRERITQAIERLRSEDPENVNLARQASLIHNAQICTIDSFCSFVVRNHFGEINLDPNFRIADEGEIRLLEQDVMEELFEQEYVLGRSSFFRLGDAYSNKRSDRPVREMVAQIYRQSQSCPWPKAWVKGIGQIYQAKTVEELLTSRVMQEAARTLYTSLEEFHQTLKEYLELALGPQGMPKYVDRLTMDVVYFDTLKPDMDLEQLLDFLNGVDLPSLPTIKKAEANEAKEIIHGGRKAIADQIKVLKADYALAEPEVLLTQLERLAPIVEELQRLTLLYIDLLRLRKDRRRIADFSDVEHFALQILVDEATGSSTQTAREFRQHYEEIMIDEYQDSNQVQEEILTAISGMSEGNYNMFMVGDVKQSIYRFRQAKPELFMDKYATYTKGDSKQQKIELHKNFRSRAEVLTFINDIFYKIMAADLGNVAYDEDAALYPGAVYPENELLGTESVVHFPNEPLTPSPIAHFPSRAAQVLLLDRKDFEDLPLGGEEDAVENDRQRLEARMVGSKIHKLMAEGRVTDRATGQLRPVHYRDIVILFRSTKGWADNFAEVLGQMGIPVHIESSAGYFSALEVQTVLNLLRILDNPYQDIPMAAVLKSPLVGLEDEELAELRAAHPELSFAEAAVREAVLYMESEELPEEDPPAVHKAESIVDKMLAFGDLYRRLRRLAREIPIHELLQKILAETGYGRYAASMPSGSRRSANLDMLVEKAIAYEKTSYKGLFHFVRYIDQLQKYEVDYGEADVTAENADVVRIMTIHKSKGLEFPVVFVSGMSKQHNTMDMKSNLILHPELGLGIDEITRTPKLRRGCLIRSQIQETLEKEMLGEELRILYVALTRAREQLILTGTISDKEKTLASVTGNVKVHEPLRYSIRRNARSYTQWILPAVISYPDKYRIEFADPYELAQETARQLAEESLSYMELCEKIRQVPGEKMEELEKYFSYVYPYAEDISRKSKYSVSEIKHASMTLKFDQNEGGAELPYFLKQEHESYIPDFARQASDMLPGNRNADPIVSDQKEPVEVPRGGKESGGVNPGALRGTAVHRVMECMHFAALMDIDRSNPDEVKAFVEKELKAMLDQGQLTDEMYRMIPTHRIEAFVADDIAGRMARADAEGMLFKEKPFVMSKDGVLIQGIIDVFWMEGDHIVLLDYKTDRVQSAQRLVDMYAAQLQLYGEALDRIFINTKRKAQVRKELLYSFALQQVIEV